MPTTAPIVGKTACSSFDDGKAATHSQEGRLPLYGTVGKRVELQEEEKGLKEMKKASRI
jgi:hypothetical protein